MPDDPDESFIVETILRRRPEGAPVGPTSAAMTPGDDAAVLPNHECVTVDAMVEGVHWDDRLGPWDVGWKLVAANASDINAMGGTPTWAVLTIALPRPLDRAWVTAFSEGLGAGLQQWNIALIGGDTTRSTGPKMVSLTVCGSAPLPVGRDGAQVGDDLWVSGPLGGPAAAFASPRADPAPLKRPTPPIGLGRQLAGIATAMMDLSDGLARDLPRLCRASEVGALVDPDAVPIHAQAAGSLSLAVGFGEEYELLFTAPTHRRDDVMATATAFGRTPVRIGRMRSTCMAELEGMAWPTPMFSHFGGDR